MNSKSIWMEESLKKEKKETVKKKDLIFNSDVLIIGGGITGLSTAYFLMDKNLSVTLIEKDKVGNAITAKTTAKINYFQKIIYQQLESKLGKDTSKLYYDSQKDAISLLTGIIEKEKINCDLKKCDSYIFTKNKKDIPKIYKEQNLLTSWGEECEITTSLPIHFPIFSAAKVKNTYTFHPLKYTESIKKIIKKKINLYEQVTAFEIKKEKEKFCIQTTQGTFHAKYVIVACHYPFFIIPGWIPIKTYIEREYVNCAKIKDHKNYFTAISIDSTLHSIRFYDDYLIYGSNSHRLTNKINYEKNYQKSQSDFQKYFSMKPEYTWMNQDIVSNDLLPIVGSIDKNQPNLLVATAFGAWGMTNATISGKVLSDIILKKENKYTLLFNPERFNVSGTLSSLLGTFHYTKVYTQTTVKKNPTFDNDSVYMIKINGNYYGIYFDYYGKKHIVNLKCPHMKCNLVFNNYEKTWDCPCHGSRFDIDGNIIWGPATKSIQIDLESNKKIA